MDWVVVMLVCSLGIVNQASAQHTENFEILATSRGVCDSDGGNGDVP